MFYVYAFVNKENNKIYVGKTNNLKKRYKQHIYNVSRKKDHFAIHSAIKKHGAENFDFIEIDSHENEDSCYDLEEYYIKLFASNIYGYNLNTGGKRAKHSEESIKKLSENRKGFKFSKESIEKMKISHLGKPNYSLRKLSIEQATEIKNLFNSSENFDYDAICNKYNIGIQSLYKLLDNETYKEIPIITKRNIIKKEKIILENKKCTLCLVDKPINEFYPNKVMLCGHDSVCKKCNKNFSKIRKEKIIQNSKEEVLKLWNAGKTSKEISKKLNIPIKTVTINIGDVSDYHKYNNINKFTKDIVLSSKLTLEELSKNTGLSASYIRSINKLKQKKEYDIYEIYKLFNFGVKLVDLCKIFNISKSSLRRILFFQ